MTERRTACPLDCPDACSITAVVKDDSLVEVRADDRNPLTRGVICGKVRGIKAHLEGAERVRTPLRRSGKKGSGLYVPIGWDEALDAIADNLLETRNRSGGEAILPYSYGGSNGWLTEGAIDYRLFYRLGASRLERTFCAVPSGTAVRAMYGRVPGVALEDYVHARLIIVWGCNPSASGIHLVPIIKEAQANGAKLIVVDPRRTPLARRADLHLPLLPGTDLPLALAIANALFESGHADLSFLAEHAAEVESFRERASAWPLERAATVCGLDQDDLRAFVTMYAAESPAVIRCGWGPERNRNGCAATAAILALPAIAGKFGVRFGGYTMSQGDADWGLSRDAAIAEREPATRKVNMVELGSALTALASPRIESLFVYNCNPAATAPNQRAVIEGLAREDLFTVVFDQVMTDTAAYADIVLPATTFLEHRDFARGYGAMRMFDSHPVLSPRGQARANAPVFAALLERTGLAKADDPVDEATLVSAILASGKDGAVHARALTERGVSIPSHGVSPSLFVDLRPATEDARIHLVPAALDVDGDLYGFRPLAAEAQFPLSLITPAEADTISSTFGQLSDDIAQASIHPDDAARRGVRSGDQVRLWNDLGETVVIAKVTDSVRPQVVSVPKGLWRKHALSQFTVNALCPETPEPLSGGATYNDARIELTKA